MYRRKPGRPKKNNSRDAVFKLRLSRAEHEKLRVLADENCVSMSELVRLWIDKKWNSA